MDALILVDLQNDFLPGGALPVPRGDEVIPLANALQPHFPLVVATQDWHPANHGSFASQHPGRRPGEVIELAGLPQVLWPDHCVQGTHGAAFASDLYTGSIDRIFRKGTDPQVDSYSGFFDNGRRHDTGLADYLRDQGVTDVYVMGLATDYCVQATALDAARLGFRTYVIEDACRGVDVQPGDSQRALERMAQAGIQRVTSAAWLHAHSAPSSRVADQTLAEGRFLRLVRRGTWEFVERVATRAVVIIVALTAEQDVLIVEQYRVPVARRCLELPAGLVGDDPRQKHEKIIDAVRRELLEETGFQAEHVRCLQELVPSAGLTSETTWVYLATGLTQVNAGGGVEGERIRVHRLPWNHVSSWLQARARQGYLVAASLYGGLWLAAEALGLRTFPG
jgi:nicotinamidase/pyrazinamidase